MPSRPPTHRPAGLQPGVSARRPSASARGYGRAWQALRLSHLSRHPLCGPCADRGLVVEAAEVDHVTPHRGDRRLLMDPANLMGMCKPCHSRKTATRDGGLVASVVAPIVADRPADAN